MKLQIIGSNSKLLERWVRLVEVTFPNSNYITSNEVNALRDFKFNQENICLIVYLLDNDANIETVEYLYSIQKPLLFIVDKNSDFNTWKVRNASGFIGTDASVYIMKTAMELVVRGGVFVAPGLIEQVKGLNSFPTTITPLEARPLGLLNQSEWNILDLAAKGKNANEMAEILGVHYRTILKYKRIIPAKLQAKTFAGATVLALQKNWIDGENRGNQ